MEKSSADVSNRIRAIIVEQLGVDPAHAVDDASLVDDLGADFLEVAQIMMMIQDEFNIRGRYHGRRCNLRGYVENQELTAAEVK